MKVVDIRNMAAASNVELIRVDERTICYAEEKNEEGHNSLFLLSYDRATRRETIIANYFLTNPSYVQHYTLMGNDLIVVMENGGSVIWVLRLDVETGEEKNLEEIHLIGSFAGSVVLSASQLLLFTSENDLHKKLFEDYRSLTGLSQVVYLDDIDEHRYVYVRDARLCSLRPEQISLFSSGGESQLLIQETYGSEQEKETCYRERRWLEKRIWDRIWACPLSRFLQSVQAHEEYLPLLRLFGERFRAHLRALWTDAGDIEQTLRLKLQYVERLFAKRLHEQPGGGRAHALDEAGGEVFFDAGKRGRRFNLHGGYLDLLAVLGMLDPFAGDGELFARAQLRHDAHGGGARFADLHRDPLQRSDPAPSSRFLHCGKRYPRPSLRWFRSYANLL